MVKQNKKVKKVNVSDKMQKDYSYELIAQLGKQFDPEFRPDFTPKQMLALGVFGGVYMRDCAKASLDGKKSAEFPADWFTKAKLAKQSSRRPDATLNFFKVNASQPLSVWRAKGWISKDDPRGWFQWYCRYYMGRRLPATQKVAVTHLL